MKSPNPDHRVAVVGLGFVGIPVAARLADSGLEVVGLDLDAARVEAINRGEYPIQGDEPGLPELIKTVVAQGRLKATTDAKRALGNADVVLIVVQTPFDASRRAPRYDALRSAVRTVGEHLKPGRLVVVESTLAPTTMEKIVRPGLEKASGLQAGKDFDLAHCPERVMPGRLLRNLSSMPRVVGGLTPAAASRARALYQRIVEAPIETTDLRVAETVKTAENAYRDVQIAFANELAALCEELGVDAWEVRRLVNQVPERNVHLPGVGVGGHCIPKDPWLLVWGAGLRAARLIPAARHVNDASPERFAKRIAAALRKAGRAPKGAHALVLGAAYRENTEDTRETPSVPLARALRAAGLKITLHDPLARGKAGEFAIRNEAPEALASGVDVVVLATNHEAYRRLDLRKLAGLVRTRVLADGRNAWSRGEVEHHGWSYVGVGKGTRG